MSYINTILINNNHLNVILNKVKNILSYIHKKNDIINTVYPEISNYNWSPKFIYQKITFSNYFTISIDYYRNIHNYKYKSILIVIMNEKYNTINLFFEIEETSYKIDENNNFILLNYDTIYKYKKELLYDNDYKTNILEKRYKNYIYKKNKNNFIYIEKLFKYDVYKKNIYLFFKIKYII